MVFIEEFAAAGIDTTGTSTPSFTKFKVTTTPTQIYIMMKNGVLLKIIAIWPSTWKQGWQTVKIFLDFYGYGSGK
jgi:hypothetical protein